MSYQPIRHATAPRHLPPIDAAKVDTLLLDDEFDDFPDAEIAALRESLADFRNA